MMHAQRDFLTSLVIGLAASIIQVQQCPLWVISGHTDKSSKDRRP